jgi:integrase/recombinase XerD
MRVVRVRNTDETGFALVDTNGAPIAAVASFLRFLRARDCSPNTIAAYAYDLGAFYVFLRDTGLTIETFTAARAVDLLAFLRDHGRRSVGRPPLLPYVVGHRLAATTINRMLAAVSTFYEHLILMGLANVQDNPLDPGNSNRRPGTPCRPVRRMMRLRRIQRVPRPLSETQVEQLLAATAGARDRAILLLMLQGGLRPGEVLNLHLEDVQYGRRRVVVRNRTDHPKGVRSKARSERIVDLHEPETLAAVSAYVMGERPPDATASQLVRKRRHPTRKVASGDGYFRSRLHNRAETLVTPTVAGLTTSNTDLMNW